LNKYDIFLEEIKRNHNTTVREAIIKLYELLKEEDPNLSKDDMYDRIMKDLLSVWKREWIQKNMPEELKDRERQESGQKGGTSKKAILSVTNNGSVASLSEANSRENSPNSPTESNSSPFKKTVDWELEKQRIYNENNGSSSPRLEELELENGRLKEQLQEQKKQISELIKSVNIASSLKKDDKATTAVKESIEYKSLLTELEVLRLERDDLKQIATMQMKANPALGFQKATDLQEARQPGPGMEALISATGVSTIPKEIEFPAKELTTFFMASRIAKQVMYLKIDHNNKVVGWESDAKRIAAKATA